MLTPDSSPAFIVSLNLYFGRERTVAWSHRVGEIARTHPAVTTGVVELVVVPTFPALVTAASAVMEEGVALGAQD